LEKNTLFIDCDCGCGENLVLKTIGKDTDYAYLPFGSSGFIREQMTVLSMLTERIRRVVYKGFLEEVVCTREDLERIRGYLNGMSLSGEDADNAGKIRFVKDDACGQPIYSIRLYTRQSPLQILLGKSYRAYDYVVGKREQKQLLRKLNAVLK